MLIEDVEVGGIVAEGFDVFEGEGAVVAGDVGDFEAEVSGAVFEVAAVDAKFGVGFVVFGVDGVDDGEMVDDGVGGGVVLGGFIDVRVALIGVVGMGTSDVLEETEEGEEENKGENKEGEEKFFGEVFEGVEGWGFLGRARGGAGDFYLEGGEWICSW